MSDGPFKTLNMRHGWKIVAERSENTSFSTQDIEEAVPIAIKEDWKSEISPEFFQLVKKAFLDLQQPLNLDNHNQILDNISTQAIHPLSKCLLNNALSKLAEGKTGDHAFTELVKNTLMDWTSRCKKQIEEHYFREAPNKDSSNLLSRFEVAASHTDYSELAEKIVITPTANLKTQITKHTGIDDGIDL